MSLLDGYERRIGRYGAELAVGLIRASGVTPGQRVLDVGCGAGALTERLAALLGRNSVCAVDPAPDAVSVTRRRLPGIDVRVAPAEELPFPDAEFDAVLAQLVVSFMSDPVAGAREMSRVAKPGAPIATCVWDFGAGMTVLRHFWDAAAQVDTAARDHDQAATHRYATAESLAELWTAAGLSDVTTGELEAGTDYADFDDLWEPMTIPDGAPGRYLEQLDEARIEQIRRAVWERVDRPEGPFRLTARAWYALGYA